MEELLETRFQRIETALQTLIDSITTYNPSPSAALDLVAADTSLRESLETLALHQLNHHRILTLRAAAAALDTSLKTSLASLAAARQDLLAAKLAPAAPPTAGRDVDVNALIGEARRISRYSVAPASRPGLALPALARHSNGDAAKASNGTGIGIGNGATPADAASPAAAEANGAAAAAAALTGPVLATEQAEGGEATVTVTATPRGAAWEALTEEQRRVLDAFNTMQWLPWPRDDEVKAGALARLQAMRDRGFDPADVVGRGGSRERTEEEEEGRRAEEEEMARRRTTTTTTAARAEGQRGGVAGGVEGVKEARFGGLDLYDPDE